jgi:hypothetical protein
MARSATGPCPGRSRPGPIAAAPAARLTPLEVAETADDAMIAMVCVAVTGLASPPPPDWKERAVVSILRKRGDRET